MKSMMKDVPHRRGNVCFIVSLRDLFAYRGHEFSEEIVCGLGGISFFYLKFRRAEPPVQIFPGYLEPRRFYRKVASLTGAAYQYKDGVKWDYAWRKVKENIDRKMPVIIGPLDMFHLSFAPLPVHAVMHYLLLIGYDDERREAHLFDSRFEDAQRIHYDDLEKAWNVEAKGWCRPHAFHLFTIPRDIPPLEDLVVKAIRDTVKLNLHPPTKSLGVAGERSAANEIPSWPGLCNREVLLQSLMFTAKMILPEGFEPQQCGAGRFLYSRFLEAAREHLRAPALDESASLFVEAGHGWNEVSEILERSSTPESEEKLKALLREAADTISDISNIEERAFRLLDGI